MRVATALDIILKYAAHDIENMFCVSIFFPSRPQCKLMIRYLDLQAIRSRSVFIAKQGTWQV